MILLPASEGCSLLSEEARLSRRRIDCRFQRGSFSASGVSRCNSCFFPISFRQFFGGFELSGLGVTWLSGISRFVQSCSQALGTGGTLAKEGHLGAVG